MSGIWGVNLSLNIKRVMLVDIAEVLNVETVEKRETVVGESTCRPLRKL